MPKRRRARVEEFTIGWICALHIELVVAREALDEEYEQTDAVAHYILGRIGGHNVVIGGLPSGVYGTNAAASVATEMRDMFPSVRTGLLVGIAGGVPSEKAVIQLGDVVISHPQGRNGGVIQYDSVKTTVGGQQDPNGFLSGPPTSLLRAVATLRSDANVGTKIRTLLSSFPHHTRFEPPTDLDVLFDPSYNHIGGDTCDRCLREKDKIVERAPRTSQDIFIHYGTIGSGNRVIKDGVSRDSLSKECGGILCFEMEAAGVMNILPCLVVRGICDYADSHKNKQWQPFAAAAAAACAKEVLLLVPTTRQSYYGQPNDDQQAVGSYSLPREPDELAHQSANHTTYQRPPESNESDGNSLYTGSILSEQQNQHYLESLTFGQIDARHATIKTAHARTCRWLLDRSEYQDWLAPEKLAEHHGFFWIRGKPATGKSTIMKFSLVATKKKMPDAVILKFFFNARGEELERTTLGMYRSLLFQLLKAIPSLQGVCALLPPTVSDDNGSYSWDTKTLQTLFGHAVERIGQRSLICFIDALDECDEDQIREMIRFFKDLGCLAASSQSQFRICFSSRHYPHVTIESGIQLILEDQEGHQQDIAHYLHSELKIGRSKLVEEIKMDIRTRASGIFLWVFLVVQILNKEYDGGRIHALRKKLNEIPDGLDKLFDEILTRDGQNLDDLILCLQWLLFAKRPLKPEELYHAILAGVDPESIKAWDSEEIDQECVQRFVLSCSKGLAEVTKVKAKTVQFIHESVRDYLLKSNGIERLRANLAGRFAGLSHDHLKDCCQDYMRISVLQDSTLETSLESATAEKAASLRQNACERFPFLEYAVRNLLYHADVAEESGVRQTDFVQKFSRGNWAVLSNFLERHKIRRYTNAVTPLYIFANEDVSYLVRVELKRVEQVEIEGERYQHPLIAALIQGYEKTVTALLNPDFRGGPNAKIAGTKFSSSQTHEKTIQEFLGREWRCLKGRTIFSWAAENGKTSVFVHALKNSVMNLELWAYNQTLIMSAAKNGHDAVIQLLAATGQVDVDSKDKSGRTPLSWAVMNRREAVVKLLLKRDDVIANSKDESGHTPLSWAAQRGDEAVLRLLLERDDVTADSKDKSGRTPLSWAAEAGEEVVVRLLLKRDDVTADSNDKSGRTPLSWAAEYGGEAIVRLLLKRDDVTADSKDKSGRTPLSWASRHGYRGEAIVRLLLERDDVAADSKDKSSRTPLSWAAEYGGEAIVRLLLKRDDVTADSKDKSSRTPLSWAVEYGREAIVKLLLERDDVTADSKDKSGRTPLSWAAEYGREAIVRLLLKRDDVTADSKDKSGRTPLSWASGHGYRSEAIVRLLLERDDVTADLKDESGRTPLSWAAEYGREAIVRLLLERDDVTADSKDEYGRTPLSWAAKYGREAIVWLLLKRDDVTADSKDKSGRTPLSWASRHGYRSEAIVRLLLERDDVTADLKDESGRTPLSWAAEYGREAIVRLLLKRDDVTADSKDKSGRTPLSWASGHGYRSEAIVRLLLERDDVTADSKDESGRTPLSWAAEYGYGGEAIVRLLLKRDNVAADSKDKSGRTPLLRAAAQGNVVVD